MDSSESQQVCRDDEQNQGIAGRASTRFTEPGSDITSRLSARIGSDGKMKDGEKEGKKVSRTTKANTFTIDGPGFVAMFELAVLPALNSSPESDA